MPNLGGTIRNRMPQLDGTLQNFVMLIATQESPVICQLIEPFENKLKHELQSSAFR